MKANNQLTIAASIIAIALIGASYIVVQGGGITTGSKTKTFDVVMENNRYKPAQINVKLGDRVVINLRNQDKIAHAVALPQFNATVPGGHVLPGKSVKLEFVATKTGSADAAACGSPDTNQPVDDHGETLIVDVS